MNNNTNNKTLNMQGCETVAGQVKAVGTQFNGSLKVNGQWYNLAKGVKSTAVKGDLVNLALEAWESKGKSGYNITKVVVISDDHRETLQPVKTNAYEKAVIVSNVPVRDYDAENRGKVRTNLVAASMPVLLTGGCDDLEKFKELVNQLVEYVMRGV